MAYNGYTNYETWLFALHLANDESLYYTVNEHIKSVCELADSKKEAVNDIYDFLNDLLADICATIDDTVYNALSHNSLMCDIASGVGREYANKVNVYEIAELYVDDNYDDDED